MQKERPTVLGEKQESPTNITTMVTALKNLKNDTSMIRKFGQAFLDNINYGSIVTRCYTPRPIPPGVCPSCATPGRPIR